MNSKNTNILLTQSETLQETIDCLVQNVPLKTQGKFTSSDLYHILVRAACDCDSIENTSKILRKSPTGRNIRHHFQKFDDIQELEKQLNSALVSRTLPQIKKGKLKLAIDLNLIPYYGEPSAEEKPYIYRSQAKLGTCSFYAYATLYVIKKNKRFTLAIRAVRQIDTMVSVISYLLGYISSLRLDFKTLYLDRGFFSISVIRWLQMLNIPFIMPAIRRGKTGGINQFMTGGKSYKTTYKMSKNKEDFVSFELWIVCKYLKGKRNKKGIEYFAYVVYKPCVSIDYIHESYRERFGIESSYRVKNICRIKTTNKNPMIRLLFIGISFILVNIWINLLWRKVSKPRRGGRLIYHSLFTFKQMLCFLRHSIDEIYQIVDGVYLPSG